MTDNRTRIWFAVFVLAIFCAGLATGLLLGRRAVLAEGPALRPPLAGLPPGRPPGPGRDRGPGPRAELLVERLSRDLDLTQDQRARVQAIFDERRGRLEEVQREVRERFEREQRDLRAEIRAVLTPEQQERFDRWVRRGPRGRRVGPR